MPSLAVNHWYDSLRRFTSASTVLVKRLDDEISRLLGYLLNRALDRIPLEELGFDGRPGSGLI